MASDCCGCEIPVCNDHWDDVSAATRARSQQTARRVRWLLDRWNDAEYFGTVERSGRYLKFATAMAMAVESAHLSWQRVRTEAAVAALRRLVPADKPKMRLVPASRRQSA